MSKTITIGGASGYWGESAMATPQLLAHPKLDYLVYDYLAEITMSIMARAKAKDPSKGYATDFIDYVMKPFLPMIAAKGVKVIANAGGVNPQSCGALVRELIKEKGLDLKALSSQATISLHKRKISMQLICLRAHFTRLLTRLLQSTPIWELFPLRKRSIWALTLLSQDAALIAP